MRHLSTAILLLLANSLGMAQGPRPPEAGPKTQLALAPPTVSFCEVVKAPQLYFEKTVRLTATFQQATEGQYLSDAACPLTHDEQIGVGYADVLMSNRNQVIKRINSTEFNGHARVRVVGVLRNKSLRAFSWYHYRFDIINFEDVSPVVVPFEGTLAAGVTYRATVRGGGDGLALVTPLRFPDHQAIRLEWINLRRFPELRRLRHNADERTIVFRVISDKVRQISESRWDGTVICRVIRVE